MNGKPYAEGAIVAQEKSRESRVSPEGIRARKKARARLRETAFEVADSSVAFIIIAAFIRKFGEPLVAGTIGWMLGAFHVIKL